MSLKLKTLVVAVAMAAAGVAQAALINTDNVTNGLSTGDGISGNLFLNVLDPIAGQSLILNMGLTTGQFMSSNASLINTFSTTDAGLQSFFSAHSADLGSMRWNLGALVNGDYTAGNAGVFTSNGNNLLPLSPLPDGTALQTAMNVGAGFAAGYDALLASANSASVLATSGLGYMGGNWGGNGYGAFIPTNSELTGFADGQTISFISFNTNDALSTANVTAFTNGKFMVDTSLGKVSYVGQVSAVPVPAAVWLFGSGLLGLVGISRRKKV